MTVTCKLLEFGLELRLSGDLDHHAAQGATMQVLECIDTYRPRRSRLDFSEVGFMDSSGLALILKAQRRVEESEGVLEVSGLSRQAERVLRASGVYQKLLIV